MKYGLIIPLVVFCALNSFAQSTKLFYDYKIPTYSFHTLHLSGQDFLNYLKIKSGELHQDDENVNINFDLYDRFVHQSPLYTGVTETNLSYSYRMEKRYEILLNDPSGSFGQEKKTEISQSYFGINTMNDFYLGEERGSFISGNFGWNYNYITPSKNFYTVTGISIGGGYGRIVRLRAVVQAYIISKETGADLSDGDILKLTEIIEKWSSGYYSKYRDDSEIEFYKAIISITKKPEQISKIQQILNSPVYKTTERLDGMKVKAAVGYANIGGDNFYFSEAKDMTNISLKAEYAFPIGFRSQIYFSAEYSKNLNDKNNTAPKLALSGHFSIDHSFTWSSSLDVEYAAAYIKNSTERSNFKASLSTNCSIINSLTAYGTVTYFKQQFYDYSVPNSGNAIIKTPDTERTELHLGLKYYIF